MNKAARLNPYPGLRPYREDEDYLLFGRDDEINAFLQLMEQQRFIVLTGIAGSGKTSFLRAGVFSALAKGDLSRIGLSWHTIMVRPDNQPYANLANGLAKILDEEGKGQEHLIEAGLRSGYDGLTERLDTFGFKGESPLLIVIDKLEELLLYQMQEEDEEAGLVVPGFLEMLAYAASNRDYNIFIVTSLQSNFLNKAAGVPALKTPLQKGLFILHPPEQQALSEIVTGPAAIAGVKVEEALVKKLSAFASAEELALPRLQWVMYKMVAQKLADPDGATALNNGHLAAAGGLHGAFNAHAEAIFQGLNEENKALAEKLFKGLLCSYGNGLELCKSQTLRELAEIAKVGEEHMASVIEEFRQHNREMLFPGPEHPLRSSTKIRMRHISMVYLWNRLHSLAEEERNAMNLYRRLRNDALLYQEQKADLWKPPELLYAKRWIEEDDPGATWAERYGGNFNETMMFLNESLRSYDLEQHEKVRKQEDKLAKQRKMASRLSGLAARNKWLAIGALIFALFALAVAFVTYVRKGHIKQEMVRAESDRYAAYAGILEDRDPTRALNYASRALRVDPDNPEAYGLLVNTFYSGEALYNQVITSNNPLQALAYAPGRDLIAVSEGNLASVYQLDGEKLYELPGMEQNIEKMRFSQNEDFLFLLHGSKGITIWDMQKKQVHQKRRFPFKIQDFGLLATFDGLILAGRNGRLINYNYNLNRSTNLFQVSDAINVAEVFQGRIIAVGLRNGRVQLFHPDGRLIRQFQAHNGPIWSLDISPDGQKLLTSSGNRGADNDVVRLWSMEGKMLKEFGGSMRQINRAVFCNDGECIFTSSFEGTISRWNMRGKLIRRFKGHEATITGLIPLSGDIGCLISASGDANQRDNSVKIWDAGRRYQKLTDTADMQLYELDINEDGDRLLTGGKSSYAYLLDDSLHPVYKMASGKKNIIATHWMKGENKFAMAMADGNIRVYSEEGRRLYDFSVPDTALNTISWSDAGNLFVTGNKNGVIRIYGREGRKMSKPFGHTQQVNSLQVSNDGQLILSSSNDSTAVLWSLDGEKLITYQPNYGKVTDAAFSPFTETIATTSTDSVVRLWDYKGKLKTILQGHSDHINAVSFAPSGDYIVSASDDYSVCVWDMQGKLMARLNHGLYNAVLDVIFKPSGDMVFSTSRHYMNSASMVQSWNIGQGYLQKVIKERFYLEDTALK